MEELKKGISSLKPGKVISLDNVSTEQITNFGPSVKKWLLRMYNQCLISHGIPMIWKKAHAETRERSVDPDELQANIAAESQVQAFKSMSATELINSSSQSKLVSALVSLRRIKYSISPNTLKIVSRKERWVVFYSSIYQLHKILELTKNIHLT